MTAWHDFYFTAGGAAAALTGLLFVALTVNRERIINHPFQRSRARQGVFALVTVLVVSLIALVPDQPRWGLGLELLVGGLLTLGISVVKQREALAATDVPGNLWLVLPIYLLYDVALLLIVAAGLLQVAGLVWAISMLVPAILVCLLIGIINSWTLAVTDDPVPSPRKP